MSRRETLLALLALVLIALGAAWFFTHYERVPTRRWEAATQEAKRNPYLALERFAKRMGRPLAKLDQAQDLERLAPGGLMLLANADRDQLTPERVKAVLDWVAQGGYLIVAGDMEGESSPLLEKLGIRWQEQEATPTDDAVDAETAEQDSPSQKEADTFQARLPGKKRALTVALPPRWKSQRFLEASTPEPAWHAGAAPHGPGAALLHYSHGRGQVTVLSSFEFLENGDIGEYDHAELIWRLMRRYAPQGPARLAASLTPSEMPGLWQWLAESAWMALASGAALILAWLWARMPRFGGTLPDVEPARRGLAEHLTAMGRAVWREGGLQPWSDLLRQDLKDNIARTHPQLLSLPEAERLDILARTGPLPPETRAALLDPAAEHDPEAFARLARAVQQVERTL
jgi:hypothetical protein